MSDNHTIEELMAAMESEQQMKIAARRQRDRVTQKLAAAEEALKALAAQRDEGLAREVELRKQINSLIQRSEQAPITEDMSRLMEAYRLGEFTVDGGSETVEALAVASFDAVASHGHDADSYMAGFCASLYWQAAPFVGLAVGPIARGCSTETEALQQRLAEAEKLLAQTPEHPADAIHNGRFAIERLENTYDFQEQMGHRLSLCSDWQEVVRCFEYLASHAEQVAFLASPSCADGEKAE